MRIPSASLLLPCALVLAACSGERAAPPRRDLTLLDPADQSATPAVVSARELAVTRAEPSATTLAPARRLPVPVPVRTRARPAREVSAPGLAASEPAPEPAAASEDAAAAAGAGEALAPGQTVSVIPATSGSAPAPVPVGDFSTESGIRSRPVIIIGDDRCVPGRGEVIGRGRPHGFRGRL
jgi:hypothetical protein